MWNHHVFTFVPVGYVSEESRRRKKIVPTWSCWSCWLDPASPRASDSSNTDCRCYKSYLEARAAGQLMAWLYLGSGLEEQKVDTVFCFPDGWIVGEIQTPWCLYKLSFFGISWPYISAHFLCVLSLFFYLNQKGLKLGKEIEHGGKEEHQNINLSVKMNTEEYCDLLDFSPFFQKPQNIFQYVHYHWYPQHQWYSEFTCFSTSNQDHSISFGQILMKCSSKTAFGSFF